MSVEQMKGYWSPENILIDDTELLVLRVLTGPDQYSYAIRLRGAQADFELSYSTKGKVIVPTYAAAKFEKSLVQALRRMNDDMENAEGEGKRWRNRKKSRG